jgi:Swiss Army Knife RNA repair-like protein
MGAAQFVHLEESLIIKRSKFMSLRAVNGKANFVVFLDIDGVLYNAPNPNAVFAKVAELFPNGDKYSQNRECSIAASYFFNKTALQSLDYLINEMEKVAQVAVVISASWRENRSVEELKTTFFGIHNFSKYIIDKTPETLSKEEGALNCPATQHNEEYSLPCRAAEIQYWLKQHPEVTNFVVLDDIDHHLSDCFGDKFFQTNYKTLLTQEMAKKIVGQYHALCSF